MASKALLVFLKGTKAEIMAMLARLRRATA